MLGGPGVCSGNQPAQAQEARGSRAVQSREGPKDLETMFENSDDYEENYPSSSEMIKFSEY